MFTIEQIKEAHSKVKSGADFPQYIRDIKQLGVASYTTQVSDGHTDYFAHNGSKLSSEPKYDELTVAGTSNSARFKEDLKLHQQGGSTYPEFCSQSAANGVELWTVDLSAMTCTYYDKGGNEILKESIPS